MPRRRLPEREPISRGDIVRYDDHTWDVVARTERPGLPDHPPIVELRIERIERAAPRYRKRVVAETILERRAVLIGRQRPLFELTHADDPSHRYD